MRTHFIIFAIGFLSQLFFSARTIVQWILTEREKRVLSPSVFWILSIAGSYLLCLYGWFRNDFAIILGQFISYYIYLGNLNLKGIWSKIPVLLKGLLLITPIFAIAFMLRNISGFMNSFFQNRTVPVWLIIFGAIGQVTFTLRFIYQWLYSYRHHESLLPIGFWIISLIGSSLILIYGIIRIDPVLILGQSFGLMAYGRNLYIGLNQSNYAIDKK